MYQKTYPMDPNRDINRLSLQNLFTIFQKTMKIFFKKSSGRDVGTLYNLKTIIQRTSVNGNVKSPFKAHEEFALLVGKAYVIEAAMEYFKMDNMKSTPTRNVPTENINKSHYSRHLMEFNKSTDWFITMVPDQSRVTVTIAGQDVQLPVENGNVHIKFQHLGQAITVPIILKSLEQNSVRVMFGRTAVTIMIKQGDELQKLKQLNKKGIQALCILYL